MNYYNVMLSSVKIFNQENLLKLPIFPQKSCLTIVGVL
jgi:hypothetical protein